jgi:hypothetical protein
MHLTTLCLCHRIALQSGSNRHDQKSYTFGTFARECLSRTAHFVQQAQMRNQGRSPQPGDQGPSSLFYGGENDERLEAKPLISLTSEFIAGTRRCFVSWFHLGFLQEPASPNLYFSEKR